MQNNQLLGHRKLILADKGIPFGNNMIDTIGF